jgi:ribonucleoside-diphosphate reductase alpha chain
MVSSIVDAGKEEVFDFTLRDDTHWGVVKTDGEVGVIAHNCAEISLHSNQFCNLSTINLTNIKDKKDYLKRVKAATIIGTLQASYTDFPYLRPIWSEVTAREALLGVSSTGIADSQGVVTSEWLKEGAKLVLETNEQFAKKLGINVSARSTALKPEGTASCILGSSSGIHARHSKYYLRRVRMNKDDSLAKYLKLVMPTLVEDDVFSPSGVVVTIPQKSPDNAITRDDETAIDLFNRVVNYYSNWVVPGHRTGQNTHNVSVTISYKPEDVELLKERLWEDRDKYAAVSLLPFDGSVYQQAPFEACTEDTFTEYYAQVKEVDLKQVVEVEDTTERLQQLACSGGVCEIT